MRRSHPLRRGFLLAALVAVSACGPKRDPVKEPVERIAEAAGKRDAGAALEWVSAEYPDRAEVEATLRRYFAAYESLHVTVRDLNVEKGFDVAKASFRADLSGTPRSIGGLEGLLPRSTSYRFEVKLVLEAGRWRIASATWTQLS